MVSFLFLPDISGFSDFVHETEVKHSKHIVSELLELLIDAQMINLKLAEIEGDALFYYQYEGVPTIEALMAQIETMYVKFHNHLRLYENRRICPCGACKTAKSLRLKFIAHAGEIDFIEVKDSKKPYGQPVIQAHRLMKNDVPEQEYVLLSDDLWRQLSLSEADESWRPLTTQYDFGEYQYWYRSLDHLKEKLSPYPKPEIAFTEKPFIQLSTKVNKDFLSLADVITNFDLRHTWNKDAKTTGYDPKQINQVGSKHVCIVDNTHLDFETTTKQGAPDEMIYGERTKDIPIANALTSFFILKPLNEQQSDLRIEVFVETPKWTQKLFRPLLKRNLMKALRKSIRLIKETSEQP